MMTWDRRIVVAGNNAAVEVHPNSYMAGERAEVLATDNQADCKHPGHTAGMWTTETHADETNSEVRLVVE